MSTLLEHRCPSDTTEEVLVRSIVNAIDSQGGDIFPQGVSNLSRAHDPVLIDVTLISVWERICLPKQAQAHDPVAQLPGEPSQKGA